MRPEVKIIRTREIARQLSLSQRTVRRMLEDGRLLKLKLSPRCVGTTPESMRRLLEMAEFRGLEE